MDYKKLSRITDSSDLNVGDIYNDGQFEGKVIDITPDHITLESQNEDGDVVNIEVPIEDSKVMDSKTYRVIYNCDGKECSEDFGDRDSALDFADNLDEYQLKVINDSKISDSDDKDQFIMNLLIHHKATCPKTGEWELKGDKLLNNGKEVATITGTLEDGINAVEKALDEAYAKITDSEDEINTSRLALDAISEKNIDELYEDGSTEIPLPEGVDPEEFAKEVLFNVETLWQAHTEDQNPPLDYAVDDASVYIYIEK